MDKRRRGGREWGEEEMSSVMSEYLGRSLPKYIINYIISLSIYYCFTLYIVFCEQTLIVMI